MKKFYFFLWIICYPQTAGKTQETQGTSPQKRSILDAVEQKRQKLFEVAFANQDTVKDLIVKKKPRTVILKEIKYVKVYRTLPIYIPEKDTIYYSRSDTLENDYLIPPPIIQHDTVVVRKRSKLYKLFH